MYIESIQLLFVYTDVQPVERDNVRMVNYNNRRVITKIKAEMSIVFVRG